MFFVACHCSAFSSFDAKEASLHVLHSRSSHSFLNPPAIGQKGQPLPFVTLNARAGKGWLHVLQMRWHRNCAPLGTVKRSRSFFSASQSKGPSLSRSGPQVTHTGSVHKTRCRAVHGMCFLFSRSLLVFFITCLYLFVSFRILLLVGVGERERERDKERRRTKTERESDTANAECPPCRTLPMSCFF